MSKKEFARPLISGPSIVGRANLLDERKMTPQQKKEYEREKYKGLVPEFVKQTRIMNAVDRLRQEYGVEKNVVLTQENVRENRELIEKYISYFTAYPDIFLDLIKPAESEFKLYFYQRIFLRASLRYKYHYCIASRGYSKTFLSVLAGILRCIFLPGSNFFIVAPGAGQGVEIAREKINLILHTFPFIEREIIKKTESSQEITLYFSNKSTFDVLSVTSKSRGQRRDSGIIDEVRDQDSEKLHTIIIPVMNIARRTASGAYNPYEPKQAQTWISSASPKSTYNYKKLIDFIERGVLNPDQIYVQGSDYHIPVMCGLMPKEYIADVKNDTTYKEENFAQEYLSIFTGSSAHAWLSSIVLGRSRKIVNAQYAPQSSFDFYVISVDVARTGDARTVYCVWGVKQKQTFFMKYLVNIATIPSSSRHFRNQANIIKEQIRIFNPKRVIIDSTGLGKGLLDFMIAETPDEDKGIIYPAYGVLNSHAIQRTQPKNAPMIIDDLNVTGSLASEIHSIAYSECTSGHIRLLRPENTTKTALMATEKGRKMPIEQRVHFLMPFEETTRLVEEIGNLRTKTDKTIVSSSVVLERVNKDIQKDRFSAFEYGIYCIRKIEDESLRRHKIERRNWAGLLMMN